MVSKIFNALGKRMRQLGAALSGESSANVDEYVLEHFLLYHGLVGSSPDNRRTFKDVRADIKNAVQETNSLKMSIALKVPPLWWDDKLKTIFTEIVDAEGPERSITALHPNLSDDAWPNRFDPLGHAEWHVRANAASMLALLNARQCAPRMVRALDDSALVSKAAFPHIAYALGRLGGEQAKEALERFLYDEEPWFCVDAAGALAHWPLVTVGEQLMKALLSNHSLSDYVAVVVARNHKPREFFESTHPSARDGACAMTIALLDAASGTFSNDVIEEFELVDCAPILLERATASPNPLNVRAAIALFDWIETHADPDSVGMSVEQLTATLERLRGSDVKESIVSTLKNWREHEGQSSAQLRQAVILAGDLKIKSAEPFLIDMLEPENKLLDSVVDALGKISDEQVAERLIALAKKLVDMNSRTGLPLGKQPVAEQDAPACKTYWHVLRALGQLQCPQSAGYLLEATNDHAPDKREQAYASLLSVCEIEVPAQYKSEINEAVTRGLSDPAPQVRTVALDGVASLEIESLLSEVVKLTDSIEISVSRKAFDVLARLCQGAHKNEVAKALEEAARNQSNKFRKDRLLEFLAVNAR